MVTELERPKGGRRKFALVAVIVAALALASAAALLLQGALTNDPASQVRSAYAAHLKDFESEDVTALTAGYQSNATIQLTGNILGLGGDYHSVTNITTLYRFILSRAFFATVGVTNLNYSVNVKGNEAVVNSTFTMQGNSTSPAIGTGTYVAKVVSGVSYIHIGNAWFISKETLDFVTLYLSA